MNRWVIFWRYFRHILYASLLFCANSCTHSEKSYDQSLAKMTVIAQVAAMQDHKIAERQKSKLPPAVSTMLAKPTKIHRSRRGKRFDVFVNQMPVSDFFAYLSTTSDQNIIIGPKLEGTITLHLKRVRLADVFSAMRDSYGFSIEKTSYGYTITEAKLVTRSYFIARLAMTRKGSSNMVINDMSSSNSDSSSSSTDTTSTSKGWSTGGQSSSVESEFDSSEFWTELKASIEALIGTTKEGGGGTVSTNPAAGMVVVRAMPKAQQQVADYIHMINEIGGKQVVIDAIVLEITRKYTESVGLTSLSLPDFTWNTTSGATFSYGASASNTSLTAVLNMMSHLGKVSLLSRPRITTMNNQKALIKVGKDEYYSLALTSATSVSTSTTTTSGFNLQSFFSGIALDITPQVQPDNSIMLHIHPIISKITPATYTVIDAGETSSLSVPATSITETDTLVKARSGQVIVIAGLMSEEVQLDKDSLPITKSRSLTYNKDNQVEKKELFILLRPVLVKDELWTNQLDHIGNIYGYQDSST